MVSYNSKFDAGANNLPQGANLGDTPFPNFTASENLGKMLFFSQRTRCFTCHLGVTFSAQGPRNNGLDLIYEDNGLGEVTGNPQDNGMFKSNSLRNVALTAPFMHDGRFATLEQVIEHYNSGVQAHPNLSPQLRTGQPGGPGSNVPRRLNLNEEEKQALIDFLHTLTDFEMINDEKFADPFNR